MDFFHGQEALTIIQWILRAIVSYFFLLFAAKIMGQRAISQLRLLDFLIALIIGNILAHPLSDEQLGLKGPLITTAVLVLLYIFCVFLSLKWGKLRSFFENSPFPLIENGQIVYKSLAKARISIDFLLSELRKEKIEDIQKVALALWEPDGTISFFLNPQYEAVTPADLELVTKTFSFPRTIIKEGKIDFSELTRIGKDEEWLKNRIKTAYSEDVYDILLATIDNNDTVKIFLYK
ncbi:MULTISPECIES: DUF421 domain-containing protein [Peribacillus]|jgi:uncharacterized membrane protein YcaP (DUF421 family)|uniref:DUF421 domain-containing protein n=2 Tax=Bacillaceae TaxID=186817 RepID=UPI0006A6C6A8|nr:MULTISPECIES: DUF421 domain-containing protein [Peribacillus]KQU24275.1 hypothetical protein ASG65_18560 [Bacillus sp. Leaf13]KON70514.1 membrane protein [Peribacillus butanolivorans]MBK5443073.1 DUF421 domain-containing protein [Peribacillus sp. TH24]MBK5484475.1 DUF421 domain-containing protein [Peribacillus sp. TH16]MBK5500339.1 DUF421 domain-containing protein [Peribacillus sp. TH14]